MFPLVRVVSVPTRVVVRLSPPANVNVNNLLAISIQDCASHWAASAERVWR